MEVLKKLKIGNWWNSLAEFYEQAPVSANPMADILKLKMPELKVQIELVLTVGLNMQQVKEHVGILKKGRHEKG
ncbi:hypothetical protein EFN80_05375 [Lactococcus lactis]|uniref:Uncharacterized protein n=1 Tax=Lactococcus lactis TaxID=1358 RepID=A0A9X4NLB4_9LACT|nr:hypothetical protein [Lactococcus lactis]MCT1192197.1 hypothetical protein [Lactococcus lactis]MCT3087256.1 hypothetical protein [Lactococcus lactis]MDG4984678.1 hypothetical protein [Lactococcus lactis]MDG4987324.1 hypothetical protein [Lactococcus lactis]